MVWKELVISDPKPYEKMMEWSSWSDRSEGEPAWCEYLMWDTAKGSWYPMTLMHKYYNDPDNDAEFERRKAYAEL